MRWCGVAIAALVLYGCDPAVIDIPLSGAGGSGGNNPIDAPVGGEMADAAEMGDGGGDGGAAATTDGGDPNCEPAVVTQDTGHHNPGMDCGQCHFGQMQAQGAPIFTLAGTLFSQVNGGPPVVGGTIRIHQAGGQVVKLVTAQNGNFYTIQAINFPITVQASRCPNTMSMTATIAGPHVSCNNCHRAGQQGPLHLP
jgi:hypothetical protein